VTVIKTPTSVEEAVERLGVIDNVVLTKEWERALIVATFVRLDQDSGVRKDSLRRAAGGAPETYSSRSFAALGIPGLCKSHTVAEYTRRWLDANDGQYPARGRKVELPDEEWKPTRTGTDGYDSLPGALTTIEKIVDKHGADTVADMIAATPQVAEQVYRNVVDRKVEAVDRLPGGGNIPDTVDRQSRGSAGTWDKTRESKMQDALVRGRQAIRDMRRYEAEGDLSADELRMVRELREEAMEFIAAGMEQPVR